MRSFLRALVNCGAIVLILIGIQKILLVPQFMQKVTQWVNQTEQLVENNKSLENETQSAEIYKNDKVYPSSRWATNSATVYIDIDDVKLYNAFVSAIQQWNNTGTFNFKIIHEKKKADIVGKLMQNDDGSAGTTKTTVNEQTKQIIKATVYLNQYYLESVTYGYSEQRIINTAEHELGHAIGLEHTDKISVMQPVGSYYTIQPLDIAHVKELYQ